MKKITKLFLFLVCLTVNNVFAQSQTETDKFSMHGYVDMVFLGLNNDFFDRPIGYLSMYRMNIMPQYVITPKLKTTILLEGADLFRLDEAGETDKPGIVEWAYLTYAHSEKINLKVGTFAIPFGIYNERFYASPTQLTAFLPSSLYFRHNYLNEGGASYSTFLFPRSPSGLMLFGKLLKTDKNHLNYFAYYANEGAGESVFGLNKYTGGRILFETSSDVLKIGASYNAYVGENKLLNSTFGGDVEFKHKNVQISSEVIMSKIGRRDTLFMPVFNKFYKSSGAYAQIGYTIKDVVTPYFRYDIFDPTKKFDNDGEKVIVAGINTEFHPQVIFKIEMYMSRTENEMTDNFNFLISTLSIAF